MSSDNLPTPLSGSEDAIARHWDRAGLGKAILDELISLGLDLNSLTLDDLAPYDQFHGGGKEMTLRLAQTAHLKRGQRILDVGGGLGGPARTLAKEFACHVTIADLTESYIQAGRMLTLQLGLQSQVEHIIADALRLPFRSGCFDIVWTQNSGMNVKDKQRMYEEFLRVLAPEGYLLMQEPVAGPSHPPIFPVMWARDESTSFLLPTAEMKALIESVGFVARSWQDVTSELVKLRSASEATSKNIQSLVMGSELEQIRRASKRNTDEHRVSMIQAVFQSGPTR